MTHDGNGRDDHLTPPVVPQVAPRGERERSATPSSTAGKRPCLLILAGPRLGELIPIQNKNGLVIGRDPTADLHLTDQGVSRRHARVSVEGEPGSQVVQLHDLESTNGTWVDGERVTAHPLAEGDKFRIGQTTVIRFTWQDPAEEQRQRQLLAAALRDELTRVFNQRYFLERLRAEVAYAARHGASLTLLLINVDRFDHLNEIYGRAAGDSLLQRLAEVIQGTIRGEDVLARYGGDVFAVIGRDTGLDGGMRLADRLRTVVADTLFVVEDLPVEVRISIGVSSVAAGETRAVEGLLAGAESGLRRAKQHGRNRISVDEAASTA